MLLNIQKVYATSDLNLVKDIYPGSSISSSSYPGNMMAVGDTLYFSSTTDTNGRELWKSDGTDAGTVMVKDIYIGNGSDDSLLSDSYFAKIGNTLYFQAKDDNKGQELWKSDGTEAGTVMVKDIYPGDNTYSGVPSYLTAVGDTVYFAATDGTNGLELWKSDGTEAGTVMVKNIRSGSSGGFSSNPYFTVVGTTLYFRATDGINGYELWKSDGTETGTVMVKDIYSGPTDSLGSKPFLKAIGNTLYFSANDGISGIELWKSDGTETGTVMVKDIYPGASSNSSNPANSVVVSNTLYFKATNGTNGYELWRSDGTDAGTVMVKDIYTAGGNCFSSSYDSYLASVGDTVYFIAADGTNGYELWKSDGTETGTVMVKNIRPGSSSGFDYYDNPYLTVVGDTLYFSANDGTNGDELWKSDGTESGTVMVKDIRSGSSSSLDSTPYLTAVGDTLYFRANNGTNGYELWESDGTDAGTVMVKDIRVTNNYSSPYYLTAVGNTLYFSAIDETNGRELWKSDGTESGTVIVKDINSGANSSWPTYLIAVGDTLYFAANDGTNGRELWKSDGTDAGTVMVKDIYPGSAYNESAPCYLAALGDTLYFAANDGANGMELWKSDGTDAGTVMVKNIRSGSIGSFPIYTESVGDTLYFRANDGTNGLELWKSDGTESGTVMVKDIGAGSDGLPSDYDPYFTGVGNTVYFGATDGTNGLELWKSDGTDAGTVMVKDIYVGSKGSYPAYLTAIGTTVYFRAKDGINGSELWKSDGTESGTVMVKDIYVGSNMSYPNYLTAVGDVLYFSANNGTSGVELWKSKGTALNTIIAKDIYSGSNSSSPSSIATVGDTVYFSANEGTYGAELYSLTPTPFPPEITIDSITNPFIVKNPYFTGTSSSEDTINNVTFQIDGTAGAWNSCTADDGTFDEISEDFTCLTSNLTYGEHTIYVRATDNEGGINTGEEIPSLTFNINNTNPVTTLDTVTDPFIVKNPSFTGGTTDSLDNIDSVEYQIDSTEGTWNSCTADDGIFDEISEEFTCQTSNLGYGEHIIYVRSTDSEGATNSGDDIASVSFFISDSITGTISIDSNNSSTNSKSVTLDISATSATSSVNKMIISNNSDFSNASWEDYATTKSWDISAIDGTNTVYIKFKNLFDFVSSVYSDQIEYTTPVITEDTTDTTQTTPKSSTTKTTPVITNIVLDSVPLNSDDTVDTEEDTNTVNDTSDTENSDNTYTTNVSKIGDTTYYSEIKIKLVDENNNPLKNITVTLDNQTVTTNNYGIAVFNNVSAGKKDIKYVYNGEEQVKGIQIEDIGTDDDEAKLIITELVVSNTKEEKTDSKLFYYISIPLITLILCLVVYKVRKGKEDIY